MSGGVTKYMRATRSESEREDVFKEKVTINDEEVLLIATQNNIDFYMGCDKPSVLYGVQNRRIVIKFLARVIDGEVLDFAPLVGIKKDVEK